MILTLSLAMMLWQGTSTVSQTPAVEDLCKQNDPNITCTTTPVRPAQPQLDGRYGVDRVAMEKQAKEAAKPSPQITAVRAAGKKKVLVAVKPGCEYVAADGSSTPCLIYEDQWACPAKFISLHSVDGSEHWCLKIEEGKN